MRSDPAQDYFGDGIVEEIIIGLSRIRWLFVRLCRKHFRKGAQSKYLR
jgi:TolB-like protein